MKNFLENYYSNEEFAVIREILQSPPLQTTVRINTLKCTKEEAQCLLAEHFKRVNEPFQIKEDPHFEEVLFIESIGPNNVHPSEKEIIVDCSCGASILRGADLYVAGIIGMSDRIISGDLVSIWADLEGRCQKGSRSTYSGEKVFLGNGRSLYSRCEVFGETGTKTGVGIKITEMKYKMPSFNGVLSEFIFLQNFPSITVAKILNPKPGSKVLDMCASPGGKKCHSASIMNNTGSIYALDKLPAKVEKIQKNCEVLGITIVQTITADSSKLIEKGIFKAESFDFIILDPPCSGLGLRPKLRFLERETLHLDSFAPFQRKLFLEAWDLLKPGGEITYSTCTINPLENEYLVDRMLSTLGNIEILPVREGFMEKYCLPGLQIGSLSPEICRRCICRFIPSKERDSNGFFLVKFRKRKD